MQLCRAYDRSLVSGGAEWRSSVLPEVREDLLAVVKSELGRVRVLRAAATNMQVHGIVTQWSLQETESWSLQQTGLEAESAISVVKASFFRCQGCGFNPWSRYLRSNMPLHAAKKGRRILKAQ